jgi:hypothetical protein
MLNGKNTKELRDKTNEVCRNSNLIRENKRHNNAILHQIPNTGTFPAVISQNGRAMLLPAEMMVG